VELLLVRHGVAEPAARGTSDRERALTDEGRAKMKRIARALVRIVGSAEVLWTSPLVRAKETAALIAEEFELGPKETSALVLDASPQELFELLGGSSGRAIAVGHEPHLSTFIAAALGVSDGSRFALKKGGCCLLQFGDAPRPGRGVLLWLATSGMLRKMRP